jgi:drug/metabolite transporter, DME family
VTSVPDASRASRPVGGTLAVVAAAVVWGTTGTATHFAPSASEVVTGAVTFAIGGAVLAVAGGRGTVRALTGPSRGVVLLGGVALAVFALGFYASLGTAGVALGTTITIGASPAAAGLIEWATAGRRVTGRWIAATLVSVVGMGVVTVSRAGSGDGGGLVAVGVVLAVVAAVAYAVYTWAVSVALGAPSAPLEIPGGPAVEIVGRSRPSRAGVLGAVFAVAAVPLAVVAVVAGPTEVADAANWPVFVYLALVPTVLGHSLYAVGLRTVSATLATLLSLLEPVVAAVLAVVVVGERLGVWGWVGVVLVVVGLALLAVPGRRSAR